MRYAVGPSKHALGLTDTEIRARMTPGEYKRFREWMIGQTVSMVCDDLVMYRHDVERFLLAARNGIPTDWD